MTEKRFTHKRWYNERQLFDGEEPFAIVDVYNQADKICGKLNKLHEDVEKQREFKFSAIRQANRIDKENEQLKSDNKIYVKRYGELFDEYIKLEKENNEIKNDEEQLSINFLGYKLKLKKILQKRYAYANEQCQLNQIPLASFSRTTALFLKDCAFTAGRSSLPSPSVTKLTVHCLKRKTMPFS